MLRQLAPATDVRPSRFARTRGSKVARGGPVVVAAAATFLLAYDNGAYSVSSWGGIAVGVAWALAFGAMLRLWPVERVPWIGWAIAASLTGYMLVSALSVLWASDADRALESTNRIGLYVLVYVAVGVAGFRTVLARWLDGAAIGVVAIGVIAFASRTLPALLPGDRNLIDVLPQVVNRLSYPVGYWNGLGLLVALAIPLLLRAAVTPGLWIRVLAMTPFPLLATVVYMTSSRGAMVACAIGAAVFVTLAEERVVAAATASIAAGGSAVAIVAIAHYRALVNHPESGPAVAQGRSAIVVILLVSLFTAALYLAAFDLVRLSARTRERLPRLLLIAAIPIAVVALVLSHPVERLRAFTAPPAAAAAAPAPHGTDPVQAHLRSLGSTGRWQQWEASLAEFRAHPIGGGGAGSFEAWWLEHGSIAGYVKYGHSIYFETLGELGIAGALCIAAFAALAMLGSIARTRRARGPRRTTFAALTAIVIAYLFSTAIDWMWQLPAVTILAISALACLTGAPGFVGPPLSELAPARSRPMLALIGVAATIALCIEGLPLLAHVRLQQSQRAVRAGDEAAAIARGEAARRIEPWAAPPYTQIALVYEQAGDFRAAQQWLARAIERSPDDWTLWVARARIEAKAGDVRAAVRSIDHARRLSPHSLLFNPA